MTLKINKLVIINDPKPQPDPDEPEKERDVPTAARHAFLKDDSLLKVRHSQYVKDMLTKD